MHPKLNLLSLSISLLTPFLSSFAFAELIDKTIWLSNTTKTYADLEINIDKENNQGLDLINAHVTLTGNSKINTVGTGIYIGAAPKGSSSLKNIGTLSIETTGRDASGININKGIHSINLGTGANIKTHGPKAYGILIYSQYSNEDTLTAKDLNIQTTGQNAHALAIQSGKIIIDGANFTTQNGSGISSDTLIYQGSIIDLNISTADLDITGGYGVLSRGTWSKVNIKDTNIKVTKGSNINPLHALRGQDGGQFNIENININAAKNVYGIVGLSAAKFTLTGNTTIQTAADSDLRLAMIANGANTKIDLNGKASITGDIITENQGLINLDTHVNSVISGSISNKENGLLNFKGEGTTWNVNADSNLNTLHLSNNSNINFAYSNQFNTLQVDDFSGSTNLNFKVDFDNDQSDKLKIINTGTGNHTVSLVNRGSANTDGSERLTIIETPNLDSNFTSKGKYEFGGYLYGVQRINNDPNSTDWEVAATGEKTDPAQATLGTVMGNYLINLAEQEQLSQRMGILHNNNSANKPESGGWIRSYTGKFNAFASDQLKGFDMKYYGLQMGADHQVMQLDNAVWYLGAALGYTTSDQDYDFGTGTQKSYSGTIYATYLTESQWYADFYVKYAHYKNKLNVQDSLGAQVNGSGSSNGFTASAESGKRIQLNQAFYIEPTAQLIVGRVDSNHINNSNGLNVDFNTQNTVLFRASNKFGFDTRIKNQPISLYAKLGYAHEFDAKQKYSLNNSAEKINFGGHWIEYGLGASTLFNKTNTVFFEATSNQGNRFDSYSANLGYKFFF